MSVLINRTMARCRANCGIVSGGDLDDKEEFENHK